MGRPGRVVIAGAPEGFDAFVLAELACGTDIVCVARNDVSLARKSEALQFFAPETEVLEFPAWDCLPYDRMSPNAHLVSRRLDTLTRLREKSEAPGGRVILTTVAAILQRVPTRAAFAGRTLALAPGTCIAPEDLLGYLSRNGYGRADTVVEPGEYAVRGGIVDIFPPGLAMPLRLDFFGDELERLRTFDPTTQRTTGEVAAVVLKPVSEVFLDSDSIARFRVAYREAFGVTGEDDPLFEAVSAGRRHPGMEHWLPLFHGGRLETLFDYVPGAALVLDNEFAEAMKARLDLIAEYFTARLDFLGRNRSEGGAPYRPLRPETLFLDPAEWEKRLVGYPVGRLFPFAAADLADASAGPERARTIDAGGRPGRPFADARVQPDASVFDAVRDHVRSHAGEGRRVVVTAFTQGSRARLAGLLAEHGLDRQNPVETFSGGAGAADAIDLAVVGLERGFTAAGLAVITEQDILGDRLNRPARRQVRAENFIAEVSSLSEGDLVVHVDHGIGRFEGLQAIQVSGAPHDCLRLIYAGGDKLFLPVENLELVSRYGSEETDVHLDRLGSQAWQARKARLKNLVREMAAELIKIAAVRALEPALALSPPAGAYEEFCSRFPYVETEDQERAIQDVLADLGSERNTDRLVCGDVGFGKTEVALRAAFIVALSGRQVGVVVPTTLLSRQHFEVFRNRFAGFPVNVAEISRLVPPKAAKAAKEGLADGKIDIVIGTHALLAKDIRFRDLGLLVVDEEQHFGVAHKERLKKLAADVRVLTLTATPIPRTLQLALSGIREMSIIATPPVDRLAVRTYVLPYDPVIIREAIMRERFRGGQTFYVCPRIADMDDLARRLKVLVPEIKMVKAHGRMPARQLEDAVGAFCAGKYDLLLATNIIESGLDMPNVNTIVIHRADMFGLAQLYQLRGRVGRAKVRAYAYLSLPPDQALTPDAQKRLEVMQTLDTLGAGFALASHDLDIRGAGNLLGEEQSGHIREVGIELYQQMLEEAVAETRGLGTREDAGEDWSPQISIGLPILIPEPYIADLNIRMGLYRRMSTLTAREEIDAFAAELIDRFGPVPPEVENLLATVALKRLCRDAGVERVEAGPKGALVAFRNTRYANPAGLVEFITRQRGSAKLRPDHRLVYMRAWDDPSERLKGVQYLLNRLAEIATRAAA
ncbi:MAG: transcription-repair coupling factor [Rhodospirillales bacterium]|nr:transcription-repair coupling factor [Rhodospirillales bacterium]